MGWLNTLGTEIILKPIKCRHGHTDFEIGQIVGISSGEFGLANMILAAVSVGTVRDLCYQTT